MVDPGGTNVNTLIDWVIYIIFTGNKEITGNNFHFGDIMRIEDLKKID